MLKLDTGIDLALLTQALPHNILKQTTMSHNKYHLTFGQLLIKISQLRLKLPNPSHYIGVGLGVSLFYLG
jgi:hypothetical protein